MEGQKIGKCKVSERKMICDLGAVNVDLWSLQITFELELGVYIAF